MVTVIIAAAGQGKRMGGEGNKVFLPLAGKSILAHTIARFAVCSLVDEMIIVAASGEEAAVSKIARLEARNVPLPAYLKGVIDHQKKPERHTIHFVHNAQVSPICANSKVSTPTTSQ